MKTLEIAAELLPRPKQRVALRRALRSELKRSARRLLEDLGYHLEDARIVGGRTTRRATISGKQVFLAIKTAGDRWLGVSREELDGQLNEIDQLIVVTFKDVPKRSVLQVYRFDPAKVVEMGRIVFNAAKKTQGVQWLPFDDTADKNVVSMAAGNLKAHGTLLTEVKVNWTGNPSEDIPVEPSVGELKLTIPQAKAGLAAYFGVRPENIKITIEV